MNCKHCKAVMTENAKFCRSCGTQVSITQQSIPANPVLTSESSLPQGANLMAQSGGNLIAAPSEAGEIIFGGVLPQITGGVIQAVNPVQVLFSGTWNVIRNFGLVFKDKKKWIPAIVLAAAWFVFTLLPILNINPQAVQTLSWLTFANGGISQSGNPDIMRIAGGIFGKGIVAFFLFSLLSGGTFKSMASGIKTMFSSFACKSMGETGLLLCGAGLALALYNFMTGYAVLSMSMAGISAFFLSLRALGNQTGFLRRFFGGFTAKKTTAGKRVNTSAVNRIIAGMAAGFALSVPLSVLSIFYLPYLLGGLTFIAGFILGIAGNTKKGETTV